MGLLLSVLVICVSVVEFLSILSNFRRTLVPLAPAGDLSPLVLRYEEGLHAERRRILGILEKCRESEGANENGTCAHAYGPTEPPSLPKIRCSDVRNDKRIGERARGNSVCAFNSTEYWENSHVIEKHELKVPKRRVKFGYSLEEGDRNWSRTPSPIFFKVEESDDSARESSSTLQDDAWDVNKKTVSSDEDESNPHFDSDFLQTLDGVKKRKCAHRNFGQNDNVDSWNPDRVPTCSDEDSGVSSANGPILHTDKRKRSFRKKKYRSREHSFELRPKTAEVSSSDFETDAPENVDNNSLPYANEQFEPVDQHCDKERNSASNAFWLIFSGEYTKAMNKDWHGQHFCCWQCDESLTGQRYVLRDEHPYCVQCYETVFANSCEKCSKTIGIDSKDLSYKDKHWHEACFLCATCGDSLVDKQFGSKGERIYCGRCYDEQFASRCDGCGQIFRAGTKKMEYKTRQWHEKCFCCNVCKTPIGTQSFIPREQEIYCAKCYEDKYATRCIKCNKVITSGGVTYKNEPWHRECFTCTNCNTSLAGARFTSRDDKPYCAECFGELFAKRCTSCNKPITGIGGTKFISFEDRHWHNDCFYCANCRTSLVGRGFITDADDIICPDCAKKNFM
ncbi:zinc finger protein 3 isoform X1 [Photinus pyralis]|nr:zinc finger protein 3 isoform X1 [Photinus pyralis]